MKNPIGKQKIKKELLCRRLHARIPVDLMKQIDNEAREKGVSLRQIVESALIDRYDPPQQVSRDAVIARRLNRIDNRVKVVEKQEEIIAEYLGMFIKMWLMVNEELPSEKRAEAHSKALKRFQVVMSSVNERIASGDSFLISFPKERAFS